MLIDFIDAEAPQEYSADVAIAGSGPAGLSLAFRLADAGYSVLVLEAGGATFEQDSQDLYDGELLGRDYSLTGTRLRQFGGTSGHWNGQTDALRPYDLVGKPWLPQDIGWGISFDDLDPYHAQAHEFLELGSGDRAVITQATRNGVGARGDEAFGYNRAWKYRSRDGLRFALRLAERDLAVIEQHERIDCLLHANVIGFERSEPGDHVTRLKFRTLSGKEGTASARLFVLACGGLENPRLLLNMIDEGPLGDPSASAHLGKYFQEHPNCMIGTIAATKTGSDYIDPAITYTEDESGAGESLWKPYLNISPEAQEREQIGAGYFRFYEPTLRQASGIEPPPRSLAGKAIWAARNIDELAYSFIPKSLRSDANVFRLIRFYSEFEQTPSVDNFVSLGAERDRLGLRKLRFNWKIGAREVQTVLGVAKEFARFLAKEQFGRLALDSWLTGSVEEAIQDIGWGYAAHHIGTTRLATSAAQGVVDTDLKYFGVDNLYVAGSSVFPSSGFANPTLTLTALSYRLADHMIARLQ
ncbi:MAG: GMC oxidoreductase [Henriciella sp.]